MAKRLADTDIWKKKWFRLLTPTQKCFVKYLFDNCDHAGIWDVDLERAGFCIGEKIEDPKTFLPNDFLIEELNGGEKWFLPKFLKFQYKTLNSEKPVVVSVRQTLEKYNLIIMINELFGNDYLMIAFPLRIKERIRVRIKAKDKEIARTWIKRAEINFTTVKTDLLEFADEIRKLRELDNLTDKQIKDITDYLLERPDVGKDFCWFDQIQSPKKLRMHSKKLEMKYWEIILREINKPSKKKTFAGVEIKQ